MFKLRKSKKKFEPLDSEQRTYFEQNLLWLMQEFPATHIKDRTVLTPSKEHFPMEWSNTKEDAFNVLEIICAQMEIDPKIIQLSFHENVIQEINMGPSVIYVQSDDEALGEYLHINDEGQYLISIDQALFMKPDSLVATLAHELAHVKLLGEKKLEDNDELLTDFATVFYGLGIFNANTSFQFFNQIDSWGYNQSGYLNQEEWAYALALLAFVREEDKPDWANFLNATIKKDFYRCLGYLNSNEDQIFKDVEA